MDLNEYTFRIPTADIAAVYHETLAWLQQVQARIQGQHPPTRITARHGGLFKFDLSGANISKTIEITLYSMANYINVHIRAVTVGRQLLKGWLRRSLWANLFVQLQTRLLYRFQHPTATPPTYTPPQPHTVPPTPSAPEKGILQQDWTPIQTPQIPTKPTTQPQTSYCNACGGELPQGTTICPVCGHQNRTK